MPDYNDQSIYIYMPLKFTFNVKYTKALTIDKCHYVLWESSALILTLCQWPGRWLPLLKWHWPSWCPPWRKRSKDMISYKGKMYKFNPLITNCAARSNQFFIFNSASEAWWWKQMKLAHLALNRQHTPLNDWHYSLLYLTSSSSPSSSEESPQSHESSESVSQESIFHCEKVCTQSPTAISSKSEPAHCPGQPSNKTLVCGTCI